MDKINVMVVQRPSIDAIRFIANSTRLTFKTNNVFADDNTNIHTNSDVSIVKNLITAHHSPLEQISYSIMIEGASRSFLAQITRHRLASFVSASTHYSNWINANFVIPIEIYEKCEEINSVEPLVELIESYNNSHQHYLSMQQKYNLDHGVVRQLLPLGFRNNLLITANVREWFSILQLRCCGRNQSEIAYVMWLIRNALIEECPDIFQLSGPACFRYGKCSEGKLTCKNPWSQDNGDPLDARWKTVKALGDKWLSRYYEEKEKQ